MCPEHMLYMNSGRGSSSTMPSASCCTDGTDSLNTLQAGGSAPRSSSCDGTGVIDACGCGALLAHDQHPHHHQPREDLPVNGQQADSQLVRNQKLSLPMVSFLMASGHQGFHNAAA